MLRGALFISAAVAAIYVLAGYLVSGLILTPAERRTTAVSNDTLMAVFGYDQAAILAALPTPEEVTFPAATPGDTLRGWYFAGADSSDCGLVMAHGITENRANASRYAAVLEDCGCAMLLYDHRAHGVSDGEFLTGGNLESRDVLRARDFLARRAAVPPERIGLVGESWGAAAVLLAAARLGAADDDAPDGFAEAGAPVAFVLADSPFASWRDAIAERADKWYGPWMRAFFPVTFAWVDARSGEDYAAASPRDFAGYIEAPALLVHSLADTITPPSHSRQIAAALPAGIGGLRTLDWDVWHAQGALARPAEYRAIVDSFLAAEGVRICGR